jgi:hypothetical protein
MTDDPLPEPAETIIQWVAAIVAIMLMSEFNGWLRAVVEPQVKALVRASGLF